MPLAKTFLLIPLVILCFSFPYEPAYDGQFGYNDDEHDINKRAAITINKLKKTLFIIKKYLFKKN